MPELRLLDPNGYDAVTDGYRVTVDADEIEQHIDHLRTEVAIRHSQEHRYAGYRASDYRVRIS